MKILQFIETWVFNSTIEVLEPNINDKLELDHRSKLFYEGMKIDRGEAGFDSTQKK